MTNSIRVDVPHALQTSQSVGTDADDLRGELAGMAREWKCVISGWSGAAASTYAALWEDWYDGATKLVETLARSSQLLERAATAYDAQEIASAQSVRAVPTRVA